MICIPLSLEQEYCIVHHVFKHFYWQRTYTKFEIAILVPNTFTERCSNRNKIVRTIPYFSIEVKVRAKTTGVFSNTKST